MKSPKCHPERPYHALDLCSSCHNQHEWATKDKKAWYEYFNAWQAKRRQAKLDLLGGMCIRCGHPDRRVLQIDHVNGDARKEGKWSPASYKEIQENPERFQLLCANCHVLKTIEAREYLALSKRK